jgi:hypothetical protein
LGEIARGSVGPADRCRWAAGTDEVVGEGAGDVGAVADARLQVALGQQPIEGAGDGVARDPRSAAN